MPVWRFRFDVVVCQFAPRTTNLAQFALEEALMRRSE
jgi:hypothetical protein